MTLHDILSNNPNSNSDKNDFSEYVQIADRLVSILPDDYKVDDVCEYIWLPYGTAGCNEKDVKEKAKNIRERSESLKTTIKESLKPVDKIVDWQKREYILHLVGDVIIGSILFGILNLIYK